MGKKQQEPLNMSGKSIYPFLDPSTPATITELGGKGMSLVEGSKQGLPVPPGFILSVRFFAPWLQRLRTTPAWSDFLKSSDPDPANLCDALKKEATQSPFTEEQEQELSHALSAFSQETLFAVRSSSPEEDLEGSSFAGGYETVLGVAGKHVQEAVKKAFASCLDHRVVVYKRENGFAIDDPKIAVIVQEQIASDVAGVGFSLNPVTNNYDDAVINANWGLGETVVAGTATPDTYVIDKISLKIKSKVCGKKEVSAWLAPQGGTEERADQRHGIFALSDAQAAELASLIIRVEALYKRPMDIEWAYSKGKLYLLQARPITAYVPLSADMMTRAGGGKRLYLDVSTTLEGFTQPISIAGTSLFAVLVKRIGKMFFFRDLTRNINTAIPWIAPGRMYVNLSNLLKIVDKGKLVDFMVIVDPLTAKALRSSDTREYRSDTSKLKLLPFGAIAVAPRLGIQMLKARTWPDRTHLQIQEKLRLFTKRARVVAKQDIPLAALSDKLLKSLIRDVILYEVPLFIAGKLALGKMKKLAGKDLADRFGPLEVALPNNVTTEMGLALYGVSKLLPKNFCRKDIENIKEGVARGTLPPSFMSAWKQFLDEYGHRGALEVDVAAPRYRDDPELLIKILLSMRAGATGEDPQERADHNREERRKAYEFLYVEIKKKNRGKSRRFQSQYKTFETFAGYRETHKFYLVIVTDLLRRRILEKGDAWYKAGRLKSTEQIFDLKIEEIDAATSDKSLDLISRARKNRKFIDLLARISRPPSIMDSRGLILLPPISAARKGEVSGTPISPGVVRGRIKVLHSPDEKPLYKGEIMVARATDPGWTPLFVNAAGLILEIGGVLQHGALVAREYGLPCVAGIDRATTLWNDGDVVEVDGTAGMVREIT